jgi:tripartite-type tricarboxylate transporter receptor subunit TctC
VGSQSELQTAHEDGELRILGVSSDQRQVGLEDVPTFQEAGFDLVFPHWRGLMGSKDMTAEEIAFWDETLAKAVETDYWQEQMDTHAWTTFYKPSAEAKKYIADQAALFQQLVGEFDLGR